ncbi:MAG: hypothetical protein ACRDHD_06630 [Candidatus Limnocylindria bacterium]
MWTTRRIWLSLALTLLAGCGFFRVAPTPTPTAVTHADPFPANLSGEWDGVLVVDPAGTPDLGGLTVDEALAAARTDSLQVRGALFVDDAYGQVWLCARVDLGGDAIGPHCGGSVLLVVDETEGRGMLASEYMAALVALAAPVELQQSGTIRWAADAAIRGGLR